MSETVIIEGILPSLNELINLDRRNKYAGNAMKREFTELCELSFRTQCKKKYSQVSLSFKWFEKTNKRDPDNIISAKKFILDGMVTAGIIPNDTQKFIKTFNKEEWLLDAENPRVEVTIEGEELAGEQLGLGIKTKK